jgi:hypothetical protein
MNWNDGTRTTPRHDDAGRLTTPLRVRSLWPKGLAPIELVKDQKNNRESSYTLAVKVSERA